MSGGKSARISEQLRISILARGFGPQVTFRGLCEPARSRPREPRADHPTHPSRATDLRLSGSITALATPFNVAGELDFDAWQRLLQQQLEGGTQAFVVAGSTGEAAALLDAEFDLLLRSAVEFVAGRIPVLAGTGLSNNQSPEL